MKNKITRVPAAAGNKESAAMQPPNPAARWLLDSLEKQSTETSFDRYDSQQPQCRFGLDDSCCRMCMWGPCRITPAALRGTCGRDRKAIAAANTVRGVAAGLACQLAHAREVLLTAMAVAEGTCDIALKGREKALRMARSLHLDQGMHAEAATGAVAAVLLDGLGQLTSKTVPLLETYAPAERVETWERLGILPRSAALEIAESLHVTSLGGCTDSDAMMRQALRSSLSYMYSALFASSAATEMLYGVPEPVSTEVNLGVLKKNYVNVLVHGHSPVMVEKILEKIRSAEIRKLAKDSGAQGIIIGGLCCTGNSLLASYGVPSVTNILGQELVIGTGAVDAVVVDMQCVLPGLKIVADCFGTRIITTCSSNRIPGAVHIPFDPEKPEALDRDAMLVATTAVESFVSRDHSKAYIPDTVSRAKTGWSYEAMTRAFGGTEKLLSLIRDGSIKGIATLIGCNSPKRPYEYSTVSIARQLVEKGILVTTTGCAAHALLNAGLCSPDASIAAHPDLQAVCEKLDVPPVMAVGGCIDNVRTIRLFIDLAEAAGAPLKDMPFMLSCPEPGNEKAIGMGMAFMCHGISGVLGIAAGRNMSGERKLFDEFSLGEQIGASLYAEIDPRAAASLVVGQITSKRKALGWNCR